jgi:hypothetical protein
VREKDGSNVLRKTIENKRLQRATVFIGEQGMSNYTVQADVLTDGRRRKMSDVGIINQRYYIVLKGNEQKIEINSNLDRIRVPERGSPSNYRWKANTWHTLKARIDVADDGSGMIAPRLGQGTMPSRKAGRWSSSTTTPTRVVRPGCSVFPRRCRCTSTT